MRYFVVFLIVGIVLQPALAFEPNYTNYFSNPDYRIYSLEYGHYKYFIPYKISGATIQKMELDCKSANFLIHLQEAKEGALTINIPRKMFDAKIGPEGNFVQDDDFFVLVDGTEPEHKQVASDTESRTLHIPFAKNNKLIEIIGPNLLVVSHMALCGQGDSEGSSYYTLLAPFRQVRSGISMDAIQCEDGSVLITKSSDGSPACVMPETKQKLIERGWAQKIASDYQKMTTPLESTKKQVAITSLNCGKSLDEIQSQTPFDIKTPKLLPEGYSLRNTDNAAPGIILLFYADGNVCGENAKGLDDGVIEIVIAFSPDGDDNEVNGEDFLNHYKAKYEKNNVDYHTNVTKNGLYIIGTGEGKGKTVVIDENDDIIREEEFDDPARVRVLDKHSGAGYLLRAFMPLDDLMKIAQSLL